MPMTNSLKIVESAWGPAEDSACLDGMAEECQLLAKLAAKVRQENRPPEVDDALRALGGLTAGLYSLLDKVVKAQCARDELRTIAAPDATPATGPGPTPEALRTPDRRLSVTETAKAIRSYLKAELGSAIARQISVRSETFSMGSAVDISLPRSVYSSVPEDFWTDIESRFSYGRFDGMTDSADSSQHTIWIDGGERVRPGAKYVNVSPRD